VCYMASITALVMWSAQDDTRILEHLFPPVLQETARYISMAARDELGMKIPAEGSAVL
jgi:hypothetical protein